MTNPTILLVFALEIALIAIVFFVYLRLGGREKEEGVINFKMSKELEERMEALIAEELIENYKKEVASFFRGAEGEFSQISKINREIQGELKREVEKKMMEFDSGYAQAKDTLFKEAEKRIAELSKNLTDEASRIYKSTEESLSEKNEEMKRKIEEHKRQRIEELDKEIFRIIGDVAKNTIGRTIDLSTHEELVIEALKKAKKEQIF